MQEVLCVDPLASGFKDSLYLLYIEFSKIIIICKFSYWEDFPFKAPLTCVLSQNRR